MEAKHQFTHATWCSVCIHSFIASFTVGYCWVLLIGLLIGQQRFECEPNRRYFTIFAVFACVTHTLYSLDCVELLPFLQYFIISNFGYRCWLQKVFISTHCVHITYSLPPSLSLSLFVSLFFVWTSKGSHN